MPTINPYTFGMRGVGSWEAGQRPKKPREGFLYLYPNGKLPLTAITGMLSSKKTNDPEFSWWTKNFPTQSGAIAGVYTNSEMTSAYSKSVNPIGTVLYVKVAEVVAKEFRAGHVAELRGNNDNQVNTAGHVLDVLLNGENSKITLSLLEATVGGSDVGPDPAACGQIAVIGNAVPEGGTIPNAVNYNPIKMYNYVQQFWTPYEITTMAEDTELYTGDALKEEKREKYELHGVEIEKAYLFGRRLETTDPVTGRTIWYTMGVIPMIKEYAPNNVRNFTTETDSKFKGKSWLTAGKLWLDITLEEISRYMSNEMLVLCGSGALLGLSMLAETFGNIQLKPGNVSYGISVIEWIHPTCPPLLLKTHPLFSHTSCYRNAMVFIDPRNLTERFMRSTQTTKDVLQQDGGRMAALSRKEGWLTVAGLEFHHPDTFAFLDGVGLDNTLS